MTRRGHERLHWSLAWTFACIGVGALYLAEGFPGRALGVWFLLLSLASTFSARDEGNDNDDLGPPPDGLGGT